MTHLGRQKGSLSGEAEAKGDKMKNEKNMGRKVLTKPQNVLASTQEAPRAVEELSPTSKAARAAEGGADYLHALPP